MAATNFSQSGGELRIQDGVAAARSETWKRGPWVSIGVCFGVRKLQTGRKVLGSVFSYFFFPSDSRINLHTCKSNVKQLYLLKNPNSLQEGPVSTPLVGERPKTFFTINVNH